MACEVLPVAMFYFDAVSERASYKWIGWMDGLRVEYRASYAA